MVNSLKEKETKKTDGRTITDTNSEMQRRGVVLDDDSALLAFREFGKPRVPHPHNILVTSPTGYLPNRSGFP